MGMVGMLVLDVLDGILQIQAERDSSNGIDDDLPPVLPHELVKIRGSEFGIILERHLSQLRHLWRDEKIVAIEQQNIKLRFEQQDIKLRFAYLNEPVLRDALNKCDHNTSFKSGWAFVEGRFNMLRDFCGGIATIFANTATVESDFSILGWEKDKHRLSLTDLSLEGIMQCKQLDILSKLV
jgi:hypothetical protein